jgi:hypothetical protein
MRAPTGDSRLSAIRERAAEHEAELDADVVYFTIQDLAARWRLATGTVRAISRERLPYKEFGSGHYRKRRRYHPRDVHAFERERLGKESR